MRATTGQDAANVLQRFMPRGRGARPNPQQPQAPQNGGGIPVPPAHLRNGGNR